MLNKKNIKWFRSTGSIIQEQSKAKSNK